MLYLWRADEALVENEYQLFRYPRKITNHASFLQLMAGFAAATLLCALNASLHLAGFLAEGAKTGLVVSDDKNGIQRRGIQNGHSLRNGGTAQIRAVDAQNLVRERSHISNTHDSCPVSNHRRYYLVADMEAAIASGGTVLCDVGDEDTAGLHAILHIFARSATNGNAIALRPARNLHNMLCACEKTGK